MAEHANIRDETAATPCAKVGELVILKSEDQGPS